MSIVLHDLFSVTLYPPHPSLCAIKKKKVVCRLSIFHSLSLAKMVHGIKLVFVSKTQDWSHKCHGILKF